MTAFIGSITGSNMPGGVGLAAAVRKGISRGRNLRRYSPAFLCPGHALFKRGSKMYQQLLGQRIVPFEEPDTRNA